MRVFLLASEIPPTPGGIATYVENTATMFANAGHEITVFARCDSRSETLCDTLAESLRDRTIPKTQNNYPLVPIIPKDIHLLKFSATPPLSERHPAFPYNVMGYWSALSDQLAEVVIEYIRKAGKPDAIESEDFSGIAYFLLQKKLIGCPELENVPIILTLHSSQYMLYPANCMPSYRLSDYWVGRMEKFCTLAADGIIAPTQYIAQQAIAALGDQLDLEIIPLPAPPSLLNPDHLPPSQPTRGDIIYFGRLEVRKGVIPLVAACHQLWQAGHDFQLTLIGNDTWYHPQGCSVGDYLKQRYHQDIQAGRLILSPSLSKNQLYQRIAQAWGVVLPSLWENFPNTCLESMLLGKAILASANVGHGEMLDEETGDAGLIFDWDIPGDFAGKLLQLLSMTVEEVQQRGAIARQRIQARTNPNTILTQRLSHLQRIITQSQQQTRTVFPSLNYPPSGHIPYPQPQNPIQPQIENLTPTQLKPPSQPQNPIQPKTQTQILHHSNRISVCIPFYNHGQYLQETLDSVYAVDYPDLEVLILNDGSNDSHSLTTLTQVEKQYQNLKIIHTPHQGVATSRNHLAKVASGEYLAFLDADDCVSPTFYSQAISILQQYDNVGFVASWLKEFGESKKVWIAWNPEFPYLLCHNTLGVCTVVRKAAYLAIGGMNPSLAENLEDYEGWIHLCEKGWVGVVIPEFHYFYRIRSDSRLQQSNREQLLYLYEKIEQLHPHLYQKYGSEIYHLLNQNGASWLWDNPSRTVADANMDITGMELIQLIVQKFRKMRNDGGMRLIVRKFWGIITSLFWSRIASPRE